MPIKSQMRITIVLVRVRFLVRTLMVSFRDGEEGHAKRGKPTGRPAVGRPSHCNDFGTPS